jgi:hypothetical protein
MGDREDAYRQLFKQHIGEYNKNGKMRKKKDTMLHRYEELKDMPNQKWHRIISFVKSGVRLIGYAFIPFDLVVATFILIISEVIGIVEEIV